MESALPSSLSASRLIQRFPQADSPATIQILGKIRNQSLRLGVLGLGLLQGGGVWVNATAVTQSGVADQRTVDRGGRYPAVGQV